VHLRGSLRKDERAHPGVSQDESRPRTARRRTPGTGRVWRAGRRPGDGSPPLRQIAGEQRGSEHCGARPQVEREASEDDQARTGLRCVGHPSFREPSATSGMCANLMVASKSMNATAIPVSTRPPSGRWTGSGEGQRLERGFQRRLLVRGAGVHPRRDDKRGTPRSTWLREDHKLPRFLGKSE
jgi:hypothetical protein